MNRTSGLLAALITAALIAGIYWYVHRSPGAPAATNAPPSAAAPSASSATPPQHYPVPEAPQIPAPPPLPSLDQSDQPFVAALAEALGSGVESLLVPRALIRHIVATVDSLDRTAPVPLRLRPVPPTPGVPVVETINGGLYWSAANAERYRPFVTLLKAADMSKLAAVYFRYYPLFQQAYEDLGYPGGYFNDRLIQVIDHLLAAPQVPGPLPVAQPHVLYQYADPQFEALSWGQKTLLRLGPDNEAAVKDKLRALRQAITARKPSP
jgi:hypothetical protein